jgi:hypothetical protein
VPVLKSRLPSGTKLIAVELKYCSDGEKQKDTFFLHFWWLSHSKNFDSVNKNITGSLEVCFSDLSWADGVEWIELTSVFCGMD